MATKRKTLIEWLNYRLPPFFAYASARKKKFGPWAGPVWLAERSGLSVRSVTRLGGKISWDNVDLAVVSAFLAACGFEISGCGVMSLRKSDTYNRWCATKAVRPFHHLDDVQWRLFNKRAAEWAKAQGST